MWMMTTIGFFSVVKDDNDHRRVIVRAREKADLRKLIQMVPNGGTNRHKLRILSTPTADYQFRVYMTKARWTWLSAQLAQSIDYGNFKDAVKAVNPKRAEVYTIVWGNLRARMMNQPKTRLNTEELQQEYFESDFYLGRTDPRGGDFD